MKLRLTALAAACLALAVAASPAIAATVTVDTISTWNGTSFISSFGVVDTATYGQTIVPPIGMTRLDSFSFEVGFATAAITFRGEVYQWDVANNRATGAALWESATVSVPADSLYHKITFTPPGGIPVQGGQTYVLFASTSKDQTGAPASASRWGSMGNNAAYGSGQFVFINNGPNPAQWTTNAWSTIADDLAFQAAFSGVGSGSADVPALSPLMLAALAAALAIAGALALRFRS